MSLTFVAPNRAPVNYIGLDGRVGVNSHSRVEDYRLRQLAAREREFATTPDPVLPSAERLRLAGGNGNAELEAAHTDRG